MKYRGVNSYIRREAFPGKLNLRWILRDRCKISILLGGKKRTAKRENCISKAKWY